MDKTYAWFTLAATLAVGFAIDTESYIPHVYIMFLTISRCCFKPVLFLVIITSQRDHNEGDLTME